MTSLPELFASAASFWASPLQAVAAYLYDFFSNPAALKSFGIFNLIVSLFCAQLLFSMQTETSTEENPWKTYLGVALSIFAAQYVVRVMEVGGATAELAALQVVNGFVSGDWGAYAAAAYGRAGFVWAELFGIPINIFLMLASRTLLNERKLMPGWFVALLAADLAALAAAFLFKLPVDSSTAFLPTLCRFTGDVITCVSLLYFGHASFINTKFYKSYSGVRPWVIVGLVYGGMHLFSPFIPQIAAAVSAKGSENLKAQTVMFAFFTFIAVPLKLALLYSAYLITSLESETLTRLREKLRESVDSRSVFLSRHGIMEAIGEAFDAAVRLHIKVPPENGKKAHRYSYRAGSEEEGELVDVGETPLPKLEDKLSAGRGEVGPPATLRQRLLPWRGNGDDRAPFDGDTPIRYHGALIGSLSIDRDGRKFTYSAEQLCRLLSEDISILAQFYRVQESLKILVEELDRNAGLRSGVGAAASLPLKDLSHRFENVIRQVLSPVRTRFIVEAGFVTVEPRADVDPPPDGDAGDVMSVEPFECVAEGVYGGRPVGRIELEYGEGRDPLKRPSLGYVTAYRRGVGSIVTKFFLAAVEQKFNLIIRDLGLRLAKKQSFDSWFDEIELGLKKAELDGFAVLHPEPQGFRESRRSAARRANTWLREALAARFPSPAEAAAALDHSRPQKVLEAHGRTVLGIRLPESDASVFVGVPRAAFAAEAAFGSPWRDFLSALAGVADNSLKRITTSKHNQRLRIERAEDYAVCSAAEMLKLFNHQIINHIENMSGNLSGVRHGVAGLDSDETSKEPIFMKIEKVRKEFEKLRSLTQSIRARTQTRQEPGPCSLGKVLQEAIELHEAKTEGKIDITFDEAESGTDAADIMLDLPPAIVYLTFDNLIGNSIAAVKRANRGGAGSAGRCGGGRAAIRVWAKPAEDARFINCFVHDTGAGVDPSIRERIFDLNVSSTPGKGGWGLFYVRRILERNKCSIELLHSEPGDTTFRLGLRKFL